MSLPDVPEEREVVRNAADIGEGIETTILIGEVGCASTAEVVDCPIYASMDGLVGIKADDLAKVIVDLGSNAVVWVHTRVPESDPEVLIEKPEGMQEKTSFLDGYLVVDRDRHEITIDGNVVHFPRKQYKILEFLTRNEGRMMTYEQIMEACWGPEYMGLSQDSCRVTIYQLRKRLGPEIARCIASVHKLGYRFDDTPKETTTETT